MSDMGEMDPFILEHLRKGTRDLLTLDPVQVALIRPPGWERTPAGGMRRSEGEPETLDPVTRYLVKVSPTVEIITSFGEKVRSDHILIGEWWDDIQEGDEFVVFDRRFRVMLIETDRRYQTKAFCQEFS